MFHKLYEYSKHKNLENLITHLENDSTYKKYLKKSSYPSIVYERINKNIYYKKMQELGKGACGKVYKVEIKNSPNAYALKEIK